VAGGLFIALWGYADLSRGAFAYLNHYRALVFSPAVIATGAAIAMAALLPDSWVAWFVARAHKKRRGLHP
jgi:hypothetical protein